MKNMETLPETSGIYMVINLNNNKKYIGQSVNIRKRFYQNHKYDYKNPKNCCYEDKFDTAIRKHGWNNFIVFVLEECNKDKLDEREIYYIKKYDTFKNGYNSTIGGQNWSPNIHNEEVLKIRQRYINGETIPEIYKDYQEIYSNKQTFKNIILGYIYKDVGNIPNKENIRHTNSKLTADQVKNIRKEYKKGKISYAKLGQKYGVSGTCISHIIQGLTYTHIN